MYTIRVYICNNFSLFLSSLSLIYFFMKYENFKEYISINFVDTSYRFYGSKCKSHSLRSCTASNFAGYSVGIIGVMFLDSYKTFAKLP